METKTCKVCGLEKSFDQFNKLIKEGPSEEWNLRYCKMCTHEKYISRYAKPDQRKAQLDASFNWKKRNPERRAELAKEYRARHPEKVMAQNRLNYAIRKGRIKRMPCEVCGATEKVHAHHTSYDPKDWYNVKWLCAICHEIEHG